MRINWLVVAVLAAGCSSPSPSVRVMRLPGAVHFINDGHVALRQCRVTIEGLSASLDVLPVDGRATVAWNEFSSDITRDDFYRRSLTLGLVCHTAAGATIEVPVK